MPRTLILEPTRELAAQVQENFDKYGINHKLNVALLIGGVSFGDQDAKIARGVDVLIATRAGCSTTSSAASCCSAASSFSSSTKPTGCSTWGSSPISSAS